MPSSTYHTRDELKARLSEFSVGDRVQILPQCWLFMAGARYGEVVKAGRSKLHVRADINGVVYSISPFSAEAI